MTAMRLAVLLLSGLTLALGLALGAGRAAGAAEAGQCRVPHALVEDDPHLTLTAQHVRKKLPLRIVVIGGASTAGKASGEDGANAYPHRLEEALRRRHPGLAVTVLNHGVPRQTTADMIARFDRDVFAANPTLVIWETGTVDAVRGIDPDAFARDLEAGIAALRLHKADIMLVDMQYNAITGSVINFEPYLEALSHTASLEDVYRFRRFEIMRYWSETGVFDLDDVPRDRRARLAADVYRCIGETLAEAVDYGAR
jgi:GDSL-like Lipase/Acylhydrolase family